MDHVLTDAFDGLHSTGQKSRITLRIRKDAPRYVHERIWSDHESRTPD
jgi:hypothetical protein